MIISVPETKIEKTCYVIYLEDIKVNKFIFITASPPPPPPPPPPLLHHHTYTVRARRVVGQVHTHTQGDVGQREVRHRCC